MWILMIGAGTSGSGGVLSGGVCCIDMVVFQPYFPQHGGLARADRVWCQLGHYGCRMVLLAKLDVIWGKGGIVD